MNQRKAGKSAAFKGEGFEGILDQVSQTGYYGYSYRRLTVDFTIADPICRLRRSSDNAEMDFSFSEDSNRLDANSLETGGATNIVTWMGADTIYVVTVYQQGGTDHMNQATAASQPIFNKTGFFHNSYNLSGVSRHLINSQTTGTQSLYTANCVSQISAGAGLYDGFLRSITPEPITATGRTVYRSPALLQFDTPYTAGIYSVGCYFDGSNEAIKINASTYVRAAAKSFSLVSVIWGISEAGATSDSEKHEAIYRFGYDSTDFSLIEADQKSYYGI